MIRGVLFGLMKNVTVGNGTTFNAIYPGALLLRIEVDEDCADDTALVLSVEPRHKHSNNCYFIAMVLSGGKVRTYYTHNANFNRSWRVLHS